MKHIKGMLIALCFIVIENSLTKAQTEQIVKDIDGNLYHIITIGDQTWMKENLRTTKFNDGTAIPLVTDSVTWSSMSKPAYCWYKNDAKKYKETYGALYNWYTVETGKLCPTGWRVPQEPDFSFGLILINLGDEKVAGGKLKETGTTHWLSPNTGADNSSKFTALPGGFRSSYSNYSGMGIVGYWWSSSADLDINTYSSTRPTYFFLSNKSSEAKMDKSDYVTIQNGFSVRCIKDK